MTLPIVPGTWISAASLIISPGLFLLGEALRSGAAYPFSDQLSFYADHKGLMGISYGISALSLMLMWPGVLAVAHLIGGTRPGWSVAGGTLATTGLFVNTFDEGMNLMAFRMVDELGTDTTIGAVAGSYADPYLVYPLVFADNLGWAVLAIGAYLSRTLGWLRSLGLLIMCAHVSGLLKGATAIGVFCDIGLCAAFIPLGISLLRHRTQTRRARVETAANQNHSNNRDCGATSDLPGHETDQRMSWTVDQQVAHREPSSSTKPTKTNYPRRRDVPDDGRMTRANLHSARVPSLRVAALGALVFGLLFVVHHVLQGTGPGSSSPAEVAAYNITHRSALLSSEVALGLSLLAFIAFLAPLVAVVWRVGHETTAVAVLVAGTVFLAMGFMSTAAETALVGVSDANEPGAVDALNQLQGRTPVVLAVTALATVISLAVLGTGLLWRWLGISGLVLAGVFLLASVSNLVARDLEGGYSLIGVGLFTVWMLALSAGLWRTASATPTSTPV